MKSLIDLLVRLFSKPARIEPEPVITNDIVVEKPKNNSSTKQAAIGGVATATVIAAIVAFIGPWEGRRYVAYQDIVGVWTICDGHTKGVKQGDTADDAKCDQLAAEDVAEHNAGIRQCITREMTPNQEIALTSLAFNVGVGAVCGSTAVRKFNAGDDNGACEAITLWNKAGGVVVKGLVNRRAAEEALCKKG